MRVHVLGGEADAASLPGEISHLLDRAASRIEGADRAPGALPHAERDSMPPVPSGAFPFQRCAGVDVPSGEASSATSPYHACHRGESGPSPPPDVTDRAPRALL